MAADVVVGIQFQPDQPIDFVDAARHDDDRRVSERAQFPANGDAVSSGQHQIKQDQVRVVCPHRRRNFAAVGETTRFETAMGYRSFQPPTTPRPQIRSGRRRCGRYGRVTA